MFASKHMTTALFFCSLFFLVRFVQEIFWNTKAKNSAFENISMKPKSLKLYWPIKMMKSDLFIIPILRKILHSHKKSAINFLLYDWIMSMNSKTYKIKTEHNSINLVLSCLKQISSSLEIIFLKYRRKKSQSSVIDACTTYIAQSCV